MSLTCPYCPLITALAHQFALENNLVRADIVDVGEFPHLEQRYNVAVVPKTITKKKKEFMGTVPKELFVQQVGVT